MSVADIIDAAADAGASEGAESKTAEIDLAAFEVSGDGVPPYMATVADMDRAIAAAIARVGARSTTITVDFVQKKASVTFKF